MKKPLCHRNRATAIPRGADMVFLDSSAVELTTVNRAVAGSNPARGAIKKDHPKKVVFFYAPLAVRTEGELRTRAQATGRAISNANS